MNNVTQNAENNWPEDEAIDEAEYYIFSALQAYTERTKELEAKLIKDLKYWHEVFENDNFTKRFVSCFNSKVPDFCRITTEMLEEVVKQKDLFD